MRFPAILFPILIGQCIAWIFVGPSLWEEAQRRSQAAARDAESSRRFFEAVSIEDEIERQGALDELQASRPILHACFRPPLWVGGLTVVVKGWCLSAVLILLHWIVADLRYHS